MKVYLYDDGASRAGADVHELSRYMASLSGAGACVRDSPLARRMKGAKAGEREGMLEDAAALLARFRVRGASAGDEFPEPLPGEVAYEKRRLLGGGAAGIPYEGGALQGFYAALIDPAELGWSHMHVVVTEQIVATRDPDDLRWHARAVLLGYPSIVSVGGIVEGPARPRKYYLESRLLSTLASPALARERAGESSRGRFLTRGDARMTDVLKGPVAQAFFYHAFGEVFCSDRGCRLFNARWQEDLIFSQTESPYEFCPRHTAMLKAESGRNIQHFQSGRR